LAVILVYIIGLFVGNLIGRTLWRLAELALMRIPVVRAIYPSVKQVTDFLLADRTNQFRQSRVVAVQHRAQNVWTIGLVTGAGVQTLSERAAESMLTVFVPSSPTAFSGYVVVVPRSNVIELPLTVEEALRLLISGGVIEPGAGRAILAADAEGALTAHASHLAQPPGPPPSSASASDAPASDQSGTRPGAAGGQPEADNRNDAGSLTSCPPSRNTAEPGT
jgi:uncharacterized membrane protein